MVSGGRLFCDRQYDTATGKSYGENGYNSFYVKKSDRESSWLWCNTFWDTTPSAVSRYVDQHSRDFAGSMGKSTAGLDQRYPYPSLPISINIHVYYSIVQYSTADLWGGFVVCAGTTLLYYSSSTLYTPINSRVIRFLPCSWLLHDSIIVQNGSRVRPFLPTLNQSVQSSHSHVLVDLSLSLSYVSLQFLTRTTASSKSLRSSAGFADSPLSSCPTKQKAITRVK